MQVYNDIGTNVITTNVPSVIYVLGEIIKTIINVHAIIHYLIINDASYDKSVIYL
jgi:hypothetical protein